MEIFDPYGHAIATLALWGLWMIYLSMQSTRGLTPEDRTESGKPKRNYASQAYRRDRAFQNGIETSPAFISVTVAAILAGGIPIVVNFLVSLFLLSRVVMAYVHIHTENQPLRSAAFGVGWLMIIGLALTALHGVFLL